MQHLQHLIPAVHANLQYPAAAACPAHFLGSFVVEHLRWDISLWTAFPESLVSYFWQFTEIFCHSVAMLYWTRIGSQPSPGSGGRRSCGAGRGGSWGGGGSGAPALLLILYLNTSCNDCSRLYYVICAIIFYIVFAIPISLYCFILANPLLFQSCETFQVQIIEGLLFPDWTHPDTHVQKLMLAFTRGLN